MDWLAFISSMVSSLAWPVVVVAVAITFRRQIQRIFERLPIRVKAGPFEAEWEATEVVVKGATGPSGAAVASSPLMTERLAKLVVQDPQAAILQAWQKLEEALRGRLGSAGSPVVSWMK